MSPWRSRKGGTWTGKTFKRKKRSDRNFCPAPIASKSRFVAAIKRASVRACASFPAARTPSLAGAEQFGLQFERNFAYFVQKNGAAIGHFKTANALRDRSCKCAFLVSTSSLPANLSEWPRS